MITSTIDELEVRWPNDLRLQAFHESHVDCYPVDTEKKEGRDFKSEILPILQKLNSLDRYSHAEARRTLGHTLAFNLPGSSFFPLKSYMNGFDLLGEYTRVVSFGAHVFDPSDGRELVRIAPHCASFLQVLRARSTANSLRLIQVTFSSVNHIENALRELMECAPDLQELCLAFKSSPDPSANALVERFFGAQADLSRGWQCRSALRCA